MTTITAPSFSINGESTVDCIDKMLFLIGHSRQSISKYMSVDENDIDKAPQWLINYLKDLIHVNLLRIGYVMSDSKQEGILGEYRESSREIQEQGDPRPAIIDDNYILDKNQVLKVSIITNFHLLNKRNLNI